MERNACCKEGDQTAPIREIHKILLRSDRRKLLNLASKISSEYTKKSAEELMEKHSLAFCTPCTG